MSQTSRTMPAERLGVAQTSHWMPAVTRSGQVTARDAGDTAADAGDTAADAGDTAADAAT